MLNKHKNFQVKNQKNVTNIEKNQNYLMKNIIRGFIINSLKRCEMLVFKTYFSPSNGAKARPWDFSTKVGL